MSVVFIYNFLKFLGILCNGVCIGLGLLLNVLGTFNFWTIKCVQNNKLYIYNFFSSLLLLLVMYLK